MAMLMQMMNGGMNQDQILQQIAQNNPQAQAALNQMRQSGMSLNDYMSKIAQQNGGGSVQQYAQQLMRQRGISMPNMPMGQGQMPPNGRR